MVGSMFGTFGYVAYKGYEMVWNPTHPDSVARIPDPVFDFLWQGLAIFPIAGVPALFAGLAAAAVGTYVARGSRLGYYAGRHLVNSALGSSAKKRK